MALLDCLSTGAKMEVGALFVALALWVYYLYFTRAPRVK